MYKTDNRINYRNKDWKPFIRSNFKFFNNYKRLIFVGIYFLFHIHLFSADLIVPHAPFISKDEIGQKKKNPKVFFDAENRIFYFGSKKLIVHENGTFDMFSNGVRIIRSYFYFNTTYSNWMPNNLIGRVNRNYSGRGLEVNKIISNQTENSVTIYGVLALHKKGDKTQNMHNWSLKFTLTPNNKIDIFWNALSMHGREKNLKISAMFFFLPQCNKYKDGSGKKIDISTFKGVRALSADKDKRWLLTMPENAKDAIKMNIISTNTVFQDCPGGFKLVPCKGEKLHIVIDPLKYHALNAENAIGGIDFLKKDDLKLPTRGKNLILNPWLAQGYMFLVAPYIYNSPNFQLSEDDAKFGKYSLKNQNNGGEKQLSPALADAGNYVFSCYAKGKGNLNIKVMFNGSRYKEIIHSIPFNSAGRWQRMEYPFRMKNEGAITISLSVKAEKQETVYLDGFQLEKGTKATEFQAPSITARFITKPPDAFFFSGEPIKGELEMATLKKQVKGKAFVKVKNFFGEEVFHFSFDYETGKNRYPRIKLPFNRHWDDGIYVMEVSYRNNDGEKLEEQFRFSIMPRIGNSHQTARIFSLNYGHIHFVEPFHARLEPFLKRIQNMGVGVSRGHSNFLTPQAMALYKKYNIIPFDVSVLNRTTGKELKKMFPGAKADDNKYYFFARKGGTPWNFSPKYGLIADYRSCGGWTPEYRKRFKELVAGVIAQHPEMFAYYIGSEWDYRDIKSDPHYIDLLIAYSEAVKSVYPDALVYEAGTHNMEPKNGTHELDLLLSRMKGRWTNEILATHPYTHDITKLYTNFEEFLKVAEKHKYGKSRLAFPECMQMYPYSMPEWGREFACWFNEGWYGGTLSYDLGWTEKRAAAHYARGWLVFLTQFKRVWCVSSSVIVSHSFQLDESMVPRAMQKIPNTLGMLLGNPKRYVGEYTFAPGTKCLVWEDENLRPIAAVWNEDKMVDTGLKEAPLAGTPLREVEYIDLMGVSRKPVNEGKFPVSSFPLFIRGKAQSMKSFLQGLTQTKIWNLNKLPFRISPELIDRDNLLITFSNDLKRNIEFDLTVMNRKKKIKLAPLERSHITIQLPQKISLLRVEEISIPIKVSIDGMIINSPFKIRTFAASRFKGTWENIPQLDFTGKIVNKNSGENDSFDSNGDFSAKFQVAWDKDFLRIRVIVEDSFLCAGSGENNRWNYDALQIYMDTCCSARKRGINSYDDDDYEFTVMPMVNGKNAEVYRAMSPDPQLTLGIVAPKNNIIATEIPADFTKTDKGYIYEVKFPANSILPVKLQKNYSFAMALFLLDRDKGKWWKQAFTLAADSRPCFGNPLYWPIIFFAE